MNSGFQGLVRAQHFRSGRLVIEMHAKNQITKFGALEFLKYSFSLVNTGFNARPEWSSGLIGVSPSFSRDDTQSSHGGWTAINTTKLIGAWADVSLPTTVTTLTSPPVPTEEVACRRFTANHPYATFGTSLSTITVDGAYVTTIGTVGSANPGRILSEVQFPAPVVMNPGDSLSVTTFIQIFDLVNYTNPTTPQTLNHSFAIAL